MSKPNKRPDQPQWSFSGEDVKQDSTQCSTHQGKKFVEQRNVINHSDFLSPDTENIGKQADLHKDCDEYDRKMYHQKGVSKPVQSDRKPTHQTTVQPQSKHDSCK